MKKSRYTETQIVKILKEVENGKLVKDVSREYSRSGATYYNWKAKFSGVEASDIKQLWDVEDENRRLKQMYADLSLEHTILKDMVKKAIKPAVRRELVDYALTVHGSSLRMTCRAVGISDSVNRYHPD